MVHETAADLIDKYVEKAIGVAPQVWTIVQHRIIAESIFQIGCLVFGLLIVLGLVLLTKCYIDSGDYAFTSDDYPVPLLLAWLLFGLTAVLLIGVGVEGVFNLFTLDYVILQRILNR